jgi:Type I phosphodiesterase / nucleotide pyrophosphatase
VTKAKFFSRKMRAGVAIGALILAVGLGPKAHAGINNRNGIKHVLLISVDGFHALDYLNCSNGIAGVNGGAPYCPHLAALATTGVNYLDTSTSKPSDSFPGLMSIVSGGSPRTMGVNYDVAYDRALNPPSQTAGNGLPSGPCTPGAAPGGTGTEYDEGIDINNVAGESGQNLLNGGAPSGDVALTRSIRLGWSATRIVTRSIHGTLSGSIRFTALSMPQRVIRRGPTSTLPIRQSVVRPAPRVIPTSTITLARK